MIPWMKNVQLMVIHSHKLSVVARKARQWACHRFVTVLSDWYHLEIKDSIIGLFPKIAVVKLLKSLAFIASTNSWSVLCLFVALKRNNLQRDSKCFSEDSYAISIDPQRISDIFIALKFIAWKSSYRTPFESAKLVLVNRRQGENCRFNLKSASYSIKNDSAYL
jgi:hypothetical protein